MSKTVGTMVMRFADADVLPYDFNDFADTIHKYSDDLKAMVKTKQEEARDRNQALDDGMFNATSDPRRPTVAPAKEEVPPFRISPQFTTPRLPPAAELDVHLQPSNDPRSAN